MLESAPDVSLAIDTVRSAAVRGDRVMASPLGGQAASDAAVPTADAADPTGSPEASTLLHMGMVAREAGRDAEAERLYGAAIAAADESRPGETPILVSALNQLGTSLATRGATDAAEAALRRSISLIDERLNGEHPDLNAVLNVLSRLYARAGAVTEAGRLLERLLALKLSKGDDHPEVATVLASLASVRQSAGQHEEAERLGRRVLEIREKTLAPNHVAIANALELLATVCSARGKVGEAGVLYRRALAIREQTLGRGHASVSTLRDRIVDLQLQGSELLAGEGDEMAPLAVPMWQPKSGLVPPNAPSAPAATRPPALAPQLVGSYARPVSRTETAWPDAPPVSPPSDRSDEYGLVLPQRTGTFDTALPIPDAPVSLPDADTETRRDAGFAALMSWARSAFAHRRQGIIAGSVVAFVLAAAIVFEPRIAENNAAASGTAASPAASQLAPSLANVGGVATAGPAPVADRAVAVSPRTSVVQTTPTATVASHPRPQPHETESTPQSSNSPSLQLGRVTLAAPTVAVPSAESLSASSAAAAKASSFSRQFWTAGIDKKVGSESANGPTPAKLIGDMPHPVYPEFLRKNSVEGEVVVRFVIDVTGHPDMATIEVVRTPHEAMTAAVRRVVQQMRFEPARIGGPDSPARTELVQISFVFQADPK
jgi:TonB family protein